MTAGALEARFRRLAHFASLLRARKVAGPGDLPHVLARSRRFAAQEVLELWDGFGGRAELRISTRFCRAACRHCAFAGNLARDTSAGLEEYADRLRAAAGYFGPVLDKAAFSRVCLEGGDHSLFSPRQLDRVCSAVLGGRKNLAAVPREAELYAGSAGRGHLEVLKRHSFARLAVQVQSLDSRALRAIGGAPPPAGAALALLSAARKAGFGALSADLLAGLPGDGGEKLFASVKALLGSGADEILISACNPSPAFLRQHFAGSRDRYGLHLAAQGKWLARAAALAAGSGFRDCGEEAGTSGGLLLLRSRRAGPPAAPLGDAGGALFDLGAHFSRVPGKFFYELSAMERDASGSSYSGWLFSAEDEMRLFLLKGLSSGGVIKSGFRRRFGDSPCSAFRAELAAMRGLGLLRDSGGALVAGPFRDETELLAGMMLLFKYDKLVKSINEISGPNWVSVWFRGAESRFEIRYSGREEAFELEGPPAPPGAADGRVRRACRAIFRKTLRTCPSLDARVFTESFASGLAELARILPGAKIACGTPEPEN